MRTALVLGGSLALFVLTENLIFRSRLYTPYLNPDSSTGHVELVLNNEIRRAKTDGNQVLVVGDSRVAFYPRYLNGIEDEIGYRFASIAHAGTTPRCWHYMIRAVDPARDHYRAIVIPLEDFDDDAGNENTAARETDLHYIAARVGWGDLFAFAGSFPSLDLRTHAALGIALPGTIYQADLQDLLRQPPQRMAQAKLMREGSAEWIGNYRGPDSNVDGVEIDWRKHTLIAPTRMSAEMADRFRARLFSPIEAAPAWRTEYLKRWLGAICDAYRGTRTAIIFIRLPRGPYPRPDLPPPNPHSSVHQLARSPNVMLDSEHTFDALEDPRIFLDPMHFNGPGEERFAVMLARRVRQLLGAPGETPR